MLEIKEHDRTITFTDEVTDPSGPEEGCGVHVTDKNGELIYEGEVEFFTWHYDGSYTLRFRVSRTGLDRVFGKYKVIEWVG